MSAPVSDDGVNTTWRRWQGPAARMGWPGLLGACLGVLAVWGWTVWLPEMEAELAEQQAQITHLRAQLTQAAVREPDGDQPLVVSVSRPEPLWQSLWSRLPAAKQSQGLQQDLLAAASRHGLAMSAVQFRGAPVPGVPRLWRQQLTVPVEASYPALRGWLGWVLQQPAMSLDQLDIARSDVMSDRVQAKVSVSVWWRTDDGSLALPRGDR